MEPAVNTLDTQQALREAWRRAKARADRIYWRLHREHVNARRRERYRSDPLYRARVRAYQKQEKGQQHVPIQC